MQVFISVDKTKLLPSVIRIMVYRGVSIAPDLHQFLTQTLLLILAIVLSVL